MTERDRFVKSIADTPHVNGDMRLAERLLDEFLTGDGIEVGDPRYDWSREGAAELARDMLVD